VTWQKDDPVWWKTDAAMDARAGVVIEDTHIGPVIIEDVDSGDVRAAKAEHLSPREQEVGRFAKRKPLRSVAYKAFVRTWPCHVCGARSGVQAAHFAPRGDGGGGMGMKHDDRRTVPQCSECHGYWHQHGTLRGETRASSESLMLRENVRLLIEWDDRRKR